MQSRHIVCIHTIRKKNNDMKYNFLYTPLYSKAFHLITISLSWSMSLWWTVTTRPYTALCFIQRFLGIGSLNFYWTLDMTYAYAIFDTFYYVRALIFCNTRALFSITGRKSPIKSSFFVWNTYIFFIFNYKLRNTEMIELIFSWPYAHFVSFFRR